jgi:hypothetical protein
MTNIIEMYTSFEGSIEEYTEDIEYFNVKIEYDHVRFEIMKDNRSDFDFSKKDIAFEISHDQAIFLAKMISTASKALTQSITN